AGGLVGEGDGEDAAGPYALLQQPGDPSRDDTCLAAAGAGENEQRPLEVRHRFALRRRQVVEKCIRRCDHRANLLSLVLPPHITCPSPRSLSRSLSSLPT